MRKKVEEEQINYTRQVKDELIIQIYEYVEGQNRLTALTNCLDVEQVKTAQWRGNTSSKKRSR